MDQSADSVDAYARPGRERAEALTKALGDAARRARLSKRNKRHLPTNLKIGRGARAFQRFRLLTFWFLFVLPSIAVAGYYVFIASDQYTAEAGFVVRGGLPPRLDTIGALTGLPPSLIVQDTQVVLDYILSRDMVDRLEKTIGLRERYSRPSIDLVSRLRSSKVERLVKYWKSMVNYAVRMPTGLVTLRIYGFTPDDASTIATAAVAACEDIVNAMNERIINDTMAAAELERQRAEANLVRTRAQLENTRNTEGVLSAEQTAVALNKLILEVRQNLDEMQSEYDSQRAYVGADAPQVRVLSLRIDAARDELSQLQARMTKPLHGDNDGHALSTAMSRLDLITLENTIAEKIYAWSLVLLEHAHLAAESKLLHFDVFVQPALPQEAEYPRRLFDIAGFTIADLIAWYVLVQTVAYAMRRRTSQSRLVRQPAT